MSVKLLTDYHLESVSFKGGCRGSSESTHVKMPHCWKSHALDHTSSSLRKSPCHNDSLDGSFHSEDLVNEMP